ncbi:TnsA-like heteromeric transposase endonuclease subunit [Luethyella okanaganae]|uniref:TnsA-like heteromeric transposase endonuclease subunit n=1 Tax=Luethyella okanaganae TaxID=69372 RepID=A0ABW1VIR2_9MICO
MTLRLAELREGSLAFFAQIAFERDGSIQRLDARDAATVPFESCAPVRNFPAWPGKRNYSGLYWSSTTRSHIGFESLAEKTALMLLDRDARVVGISSQPMWITWPKEAGRGSHAPDFFVREESGEGVVIDVRPEHLVDDHAAGVFEATRLLCEEIGLGYRVISALPTVLTRNLLFVSRFRDDVFASASSDLEWLRMGAPSTRSLREIALVLGAGELGVGLARAYRLIWFGEIDVDLGEPLSLEVLGRIVREIGQ